jgi:flagellar protein FlgJ
MTPSSLRTPEAAYTDSTNLAQLKGQGRSANSPEALKQTAQQFEALFLQMTLKNMRQASSSVDPKLMENSGSKMFREMHDEQLATHLAKTSKLGFADMLVKQLGGPAAAAKTKDGSAIKPDGLKLDDYRRSSVRSLSPRPPGVAAAPQDKSAANNLAPPKKFMPLTPSAGTAPTTAANRKAGGGFDDCQAFFKELLPEAEAAARELGLDPKLLLSQAALETGWGKHTPRRGDGSDSYNLFGIKAGSSWRGPRVANSTLEYEQGIPVRKIDHFRAYSSYKESFRDYVGLLRDNPRYAQAMEQTHNPKQYMAALQKAGYATDPNYAGKVLSIYQQWRHADSDTPMVASNAAPAKGAAKT